MDILGMKKLKFKNFSKSKVSLPLPYLLSIQRESWKTFWESDLKELFKEISPIRDYTGKELELYFLDYKLDKPKYKNDLEAKQNNESYEAALRANVRLVNLKTKEVKEQEVFLTDFPLMTERGTFIINGCERVAISQLIRSPGALFNAETLAGRNYFGAKIIPNRGAWLEFETEPSGFIGVKIDRKRKVPATTLLKALGIEEKEIKEKFSDIDIGEIKYIEETLKKDSTKTQDEAMVEIYSHLRPGDLASPETAGELIKNMFLNFERYDISKVGRWRMWQRLPGLSNGQELKVGAAGLVKGRRSLVEDKRPKTKDQTGRQDQKPKTIDISVEDRVLKLEDVIAVLREIIMMNNDPQAKPDQIDHLGNRRVRAFNELLINRLRLGFMRMARIIRDRMSTLDISTLSPVQLLNPRPFIAVVREFFTSSQICQFMDNENPLSELEHKRRVSATGPGGLARERAGFAVRDVQPSHYGRICPIQTPEGPNIGLVGHLASFARINAYGFIETPYFEVKNGKIIPKFRYFNAYGEEKFNIASADIPIDADGNIIAKEVEARIQGEPGLIGKEKIDLIDVSPEQSISIATSLIPFLQNNDANRALMGSNMQRQSVPLIQPELPLVMTGVEERVARDSGQEVIAEEDGVATEVDANHIIIGSRVYNLNTFLRTNQYACFHQKPLIKQGQKVKKGEILADGAAIDRGNLAWEETS